MAETVIETQNLTKVYRDFWGRKKVDALRSLNLNVQRGEIFGLLGPNGSAKPPRSNCCLGCFSQPQVRRSFSASQRPTSRRMSGSATAGRIVPVQIPQRRGNAEFLRQTVQAQQFRTQAPGRFVIKQVGLNHARRRTLREYSKGMTRRIGLAQAMINDPELVLLDEPTSGLDPIGTREMKDLIIQLREQGKTVIMCSHLLADVQDVCDRIAILHQGELKEMGNVKDLLSIQDETEFRLKNLPESARDEIRKIVERSGAQMLKEGCPSSTLEDLFVRIVKTSEAHPGRRYLPEASNTNPKS